MRAMQITRFGRAGVLAVVEQPVPAATSGQELFDVSAAGIHVADTHHRLS